MNIKQIIREELDNQEFMNLVDMIESKQLDSIALALQITKANKAEKQFEDYFKISLKKYDAIFNNVILALEESKYKDQFKEIIANLLKYNLNLNVLEFFEIVNILLYSTAPSKYFNLNGIDLYGIIKLISNKKEYINTNPQFIRKINKLLPKMENQDILRVLQLANEVPEVKDLIDFNVLDDYSIFLSLRIAPEYAPFFDFGKLVGSEYKERLLLMQPELQKYFDSLDKKTLKEDVTSGQSIVWNRTKKQFIPEIQKKGYLIGDRSKLGSGVYACFKFDSQLTNYHRQNYGEVIVECKVKSLDGFIILFPQEAKKVYGDKNAALDKQLKRILSAEIYAKIKQKLTNTICEAVDRGEYTKKDGVLFFNEYLEPFEKYFEGLIYNSVDDGKAIVSYNAKNVVPLRYTLDEGQTWTPMVNKDVYSRNKSNNQASDDYSQLTSDELTTLVIKQPNKFTQIDVEKLDTNDILKIIKARPELVDSFDKDKFHFYTILQILKTNDKLVDKFSTTALDKLYGDAIVELLKIHPQLVTKLNISKLSKDEIEDLTTDKPELKKYFEKEGFFKKIINKFIKENKNDLRQIIREQLDNQEFQGIIDMIKSKQLDSIALALQITKANKADKQFEDYFKISLKEYTEIFNKIIIPMSTKEHLVYVLQYLLENNLDLNKLQSGQIGNIIEELPKLYKYFDLSKLQGLSIAHIIAEQPQLLRLFDLSKLIGYDIAQILRYQPQLVNKFDKTKMRGSDIVSLLEDQPQLAKHFNHSTIYNKM